MTQLTELLRSSGILALLCLTIPVSASPLAHLRSAVTTSEGFLQAQANVEASKQAIEVRRALLLPQLRGSASYSLTRPGGDRGGPSSRFGRGITASQTLLDIPGKYAVESAELSLEIAQLRAKSVRQQTLLATFRAYLAASIAQESLVLLDRRLTVLDEQLRFVTSSFTVGKASRLDIINVEAQIAALQADRITAVGRLGDTGRQLTAVSGRPANDIRSLAGTPNLPTDLTNWIDQIQNAPAVQAKLLEVTLQEASIKEALNVSLPKVELNATSDLQNDHNVGVQVSVPLYSSGGAAFELKRRELVRASLINGHKQAYKDARTAVVNAFRRMEYQHSRNNALTKSVEIATERLQLTQISVKLNAAVLTDALRAEADLAAAELQLIQARHAQLDNWLALLTAAGRINIDYALGLEFLFR